MYHSFTLHNVLNSFTACLSKSIDISWFLFSDGKKPNPINLSVCVGGWKLNNQITFSRQNQRFWCWCILWIYLYTSKGPVLLAAGEQWARPPNGGENWLSLILVITIELSPAVRTGYGDRAASWPMFDQPDAIISDTVYHPPPPPVTSLLTRSYFHTDRELLVALRVRAISSR